MRIQLLLVCVLLLGVVGCGPKAVMIGVAARNDSDQPVLLWLTKSGPPVEENWLSPGQYAAIFAPSDDDDDLSMLPLVSLSPGQSVQLPPRRGRFAEGSLPLLRIYNGPATLDELAAVPRRSNRVDTVTLGSGENFVIVRRVDPVTARRVPRDVFDRKSILESQP